MRRPVGFAVASTFTPAVQSETSAAWKLDAGAFVLPSTKVTPGNGFDEVFVAMIAPSAEEAAEKNEARAKPINQRRMDEIESNSDANRERP